jgi:hypothetical protein
VQNLICISTGTPPVLPSRAGECEERPVWIRLCAGSKRPRSVQSHKKRVCLL